MKKRHRKHFVICLIIYTIAVGAIQTSAQKRNLHGKPSKTHQVKKSKLQRKVSLPKIFSAGVLNGRAKNLVNPEYPKTARAVNAYGTVSVLVLMDETGRVVRAAAKKGHPFLRAAAVKAARQSEFEPIVLSGGLSIKATGVIVYNFVADQWNWLEIGYALISDSNYYSIKSLPETLPPDCETERQLVNQAMLFYEARSQTIETIISLIRQKLVNQPKSYWFFETGLALGVVGQNRSSEKTFTEDVENLKFLARNPPPEINGRLIETLQKIIFLIEEGKTEQSFDDLQKLEELFPYVGN